MNPTARSAGLSARARRIILIVIGAIVCAATIPALAQAWVPGTSGEIAYSSSEGVPGDGLGLHIWAIAPDGTGRHELTHASPDADPSWSPSGRQIVFSRLADDGSGPTAERRIWVMDADGSHAHALTPAGTPGGLVGRGNSGPRFSPDGSRIAFYSYVPNSRNEDRLGKGNVWVMNADGSGLHEITDLPSTAIVGLSWSPDGSEIVFTAADISDPSDGFGKPYHFYEMTSAGGSLHRLAFDPAGTSLFSPCLGAMGVDWSPAGIAVGGCDRVHVAAGDASSSAPTVGSGSCQEEPSWSPDERNLVCDDSTSAGGSAELFTATPTSSAQQLTFDGSYHVQPSWGPARTVRGFYGNPDLLLERLIESGQRVVVLLANCGRSAGRAGCFDRVIVQSGGRKQSSRAYRVRGGTGRAIRFSLSKATSRSLAVGEKVLLLLRSTTHGRTTIVRQHTTVLAQASLSTRCPAAQSQVGSPVTLSGSLQAAPAGAHIASASGQVRVGLTALSPEGLTESFSLKTDRRGRYSIKFRPDAPGRWRLQVVWNGDRKHPWTPSPSCGLTVRTPPLVQSSLSLTCPTATAGAPVDVTGSLSPAASGATIRITYSNQQAVGGAITDTVGTAASGAFSDQPVPGAAGTWQAQATYGGNSVQRGASGHCVFAVSRIATAVTLICPAKSALNQPLVINGSTTPAFPGATITLTYSRLGSGQKLTSTFSTDGSGDFTDSSITPQAGGLWNVQASLLGDATHSPSTSLPCAIQVS